MSTNRWYPCELLNLLMRTFKPSEQWLWQVSVWWSNQWRPTRTWVDPLQLENDQVCLCPNMQMTMVNICCVISLGHLVKIDKLLGVLCISLNTLAICSNPWPIIIRSENPSCHTPSTCIHATDAHVNLIHDILGFIILQTFQQWGWDSSSEDFSINNSIMCWLQFHLFGFIFIF